MAVPTLYNDGGSSGGTLARPALQQLLADIAARKIDLVVVYKVDRLTRSWSDFAKIVDVGVSRAGFRTAPMKGRASAGDFPIKCHSQRAPAYWVDWVVVDAVQGEPVSAAIFPAIESEPFFHAETQYYTL